MISVFFFALLPDFSLSLSVFSIVDLHNAALPHLPVAQAWLAQSTSPFLALYISLHFFFSLLLSSIYSSPHSFFHSLFTLFSLKRHIVDTVAGTSRRPCRQKHNTNTRYILFFTFRPFFPHFTPKDEKFAPVHGSLGFTRT